MKILLADDHELFNEGFSLVLKKLFPTCTVIHANSWLAARALVQNDSFDLAMLDLFMPAQNTWHTELAKLMSIGHVKSVCILTASLNQDNITQSFALGVKAYIHKSSSYTEIHKALTLALDGKIYLPPQLLQSPEKDTSNRECSKLTTRQHRILAMIAEGRENRFIAAELGIKESTVKRHAYNIFQQLNANNRTEAVHIARQHGLLQNL